MELEESMAAASSTPVEEPVVSAPGAAKKVFVKTYGCQMNVYDSARMADVLAPLGYAPAETPEGADMVILNTCHIREKASEKVYSELGRLRVLKDGAARDGRDMKIAVAGCVAQAEGAEIAVRGAGGELWIGPQGGEADQRRLQVAELGHGRNSGSARGRRFRRSAGGVLRVHVDGQRQWSCIVQHLVVIAAF